MISSSPQVEKNIRIAGDLIRKSSYTTVLSGAGISTPSGIPDFRSTDSGLWELYDPFEVASLNAFRYHPERFYGWLRPLARDIINANPNPAHLGFAQLEEAGFVKYIVTQNIDGLHHRAGSKNIIEVHGSLRTLSCSHCFNQVSSEPYVHSYITQGEIPRCKSCNGILKPDAILFGEQLPARTWLQALEACKQCDLIIVAGSSLEVLPVAGLPMRAIQNGANLIIINHMSTYIDVRADVVLNEDLAWTIPQIVKEVLGD
jgi:NAD-dependent deacetylase